MANNPLDNDEFTFFFKFFDVGFPTEYQTEEPIGWDSANFIQEQESKRYARSVEYGAVSKLTFINAVGRDNGIQQVINPQGETSTFLDYAYQWLSYGYKLKGFQFKVEFIIKRNGLVFSGGFLDFTDKNVTDGYSYVACKLIQKGKVADLKRRLDNKFNLFGTKDAKNNTITPTPTIDFLRKAQPETNFSKWILPNTVTFSTFYLFTAPRFIFNYLNDPIESEVNDTLSFIQDDGRINSDAQASAGAERFIYIRAKNDISNGTLTFSNINLTFSPNFLSSYNIKAYYSITQGGVFDYANKVEIYNQNNPTSLSINLTVNNINIQRDNSVHFWFEGSLAPAGSFVNSLVTTWNSGEITFQGTETAIDTVIKGVRYIDAMKQSAKWACDLPVNAPLFDVGGIHYNNVIFNEAGVSQNITSFTVTPKKILESPYDEVNCDYEANENEIFVGHQTDFYKNQEIAVFRIIPDEDLSIDENDRHQVNTTRHGYKKFSQDRTVLGTSSAIHTESENLLLNDQVENLFERKSDLVRDPITHQAMVDLEISQPTTSTSEEDDINIVEITAIAPSSFNTFPATLNMRIRNSKVEILNRSESADAQTVVINWSVLGFGIGAQFFILSGENSGTYTVDTITRTVLTLNPIGFTPTFEGDSFITVKYFYTNVLWVTRTNEGFISNPLSLQNCSYSIKRNITKYFGEHYASMLMYEKTNVINSYFKSNGSYSSQMIGESAPVIENANIDYSSLPNPLITPKMYNITCFAEFEDILAYLEAYKTIRGYVRFIFPDDSVLLGYIKKLDHLWQENRLKVNVEEKYTSENLILTYSGGVLTVNDVAYNTTGISDWWKFSNDFIKLYDDQNRPISNYYKYDLVELNGIIYGAKADLVTALLNLV